MRLADHELRIRKMLTEAGVDSPSLCSRLLTAHAAGLNKVEYILAAGQDLPVEKADLLEELARRRASGEPLAYIFGKKEFYGLEFVVSPATLTPRPETELLIDLITRMLPNNHKCMFADLGCGSGCIGLTLLKMCSPWQGILMDNSLEALKITQANAMRHRLKPAILAANIFQMPFQAHSLDFIVSNPPYIGKQEIASVMGETLAYEPHSALFSDKQGLAHLEAIITQAKNLLRSGGWLFLEHGAMQGQAVDGLLAAAGFKQIKTHCDLAGLARCASALA